MKVGRNDPCHCGSGKKYKKCHMQADEARARAEKSLTTLPRWMAHHAEALRADIRGQAIEQPAVREAAQTLLGSVDAAFEDKAFELHALYDLKVDDVALLERVEIVDDDEQIAARREALRRALCFSHGTIIEVIESKREKGVRLRDRLTNQERFVGDPELAEILDPMEMLFGRMGAFDGKNVLFDGWEKIYFRGRKAAVRDLLERMEAAELPALPPLVPRAASEKYRAAYRQKFGAGIDARIHWLKAEGLSVLGRVREARPA